MRQINCHRLRRLTLTSVATLTVAMVVSAWAMAREPIYVADGLTIQLVAGDDLVPDCTNVTCDWNGQLIASGPGYIRRLVRRNAESDAKPGFDDFESIKEDLTHGAHGLFCEAPYLYYVAEDGVWRTRADRTRGIEPAAKLLSVETGGEHDAHALRKGPDGFWYLMAGNKTTGMFALQNVASPVIPNPRAGAIWRISPDWAMREVWAHGFRNAFDFDFAPDQTIITFDSDGEREVSLPWYRPTRVYRVRRGDDAGWLSRSWKRPNYDTEMPRVLAEFGRGSPTGVQRYGHSRLPPRFHNGTFVLDWTFGRILFVSDNGETELIAEPLGTAGFAVTDIAVLHDGRLAVTVGGRGSQGGLYIIDAEEPGSESRSTAKMYWPDSPPAHDVSDLSGSIRQLRAETNPAFNLPRFEQALNALDQAESEGQKIEALMLLIEAVGGLGAASRDDRRPKFEQAAVFDGYRARSSTALDPQLKSRTTNMLVSLLAREKSGSVRQELVRALAVIEAEEPTSMTAVVRDMQLCSDPTDQLHRLIAVSRLPSEQSVEHTTAIMEAMLNVPRHIRDMRRNVDSNWSPRLQECFRALQQRNPNLAQSLVENPEFGHATHLVWATALPRQLVDQACQRFLQQKQSIRDAAVSRFIADSEVEVPMQILETWLSREETRPAAWRVLARNPTLRNAEELQKASVYFDEGIRQLAREALAELGVPIHTTNTTAESADLWLERAPRIVSLEGDLSRGKSLFTTRQCATCHNAAKALGPPLTGIGKRFNEHDILRATVDPSHSIPDRYRALSVLTEEGKIAIGIKIYESVDGVTLLSAKGETLRINADAIKSMKVSTESLMPAGLLAGASDQDAADLLAYLRSL